MCRDPQPISPTRAPGPSRLQALGLDVDNRWGRINGSASDDVVVQQNLKGGDALLFAPARGPKCRRQRPGPHHKKEDATNAGKTATINYYKL